MVLGKHVKVQEDCRFAAGAGGATFNAVLFSSGRLVTAGGKGGVFGFRNRSAVTKSTKNIVRRTFKKISCYTFWGRNWGVV